MIKRKSRGKGKNNNTCKKAKKRGSRKPVDPKKVRQELAGIVKAKAKKIANAVADKACAGELAPAKFLFEIAHIYPEVFEEQPPSEREESLAETLLKERNIPREPVVHDLYERDEDIVIIHPKDEETAEEKSTHEEDVPAGGE